jgi:NADH-quinone oxidoreductase subunit N
MVHDWIAILPHLILALDGFFIFVVGAFWRRRPSGLLFGMALAGPIAAAGCALLLRPPAPHFLMLLQVGGYGLYFTSLLSLITLISLLFAYRYGKARSIGGDEFYGLILLAALGMILVAQSIHWLIFFLGLEVLSLPLYVLIAIRKADPSSNEAGMKYFVMGAVASAFLTFGIALLYGATGELDIARSLALSVPSRSPLILLGLGFILIGIGFKVSMVPFHLWTPDVYQGAPAPITAFLAAGSKVALFAALLRFTTAAHEDLWLYFFPVFWIFSVLTMVVGNVAALTQVRIKRLLAYSSVAQVGYLLMTLVAVKQNGAFAIMFYLAIYALMDLGAFGTVAILSTEEEDLDDLDDYRGLAYSHPLPSALLTVCLISLAGLPPAAGFIGKILLFRAVLEAHHITLAVIGIVTVIISIYLYFKVAVALFMQPPKRKMPVFVPAFAELLAGAVIFVLILYLGLIPTQVFAWIEKALPFVSGH